MYKTATKSSNLLAAAAASLALMSSAAAVAGPGKPGINDILDGGNIVDIATEAGAFNTLLAAAQCEYFGNDLVDLLTGDDKVTIFAPTDAAFGALTAENICGTFAGTVDEELDDGELVLLGILAYHIVDGRRFSNSLFNKNRPKMIEMLSEGYITTYLDGDVPTIIDATDNEAVVETANINASNGVIHVINAVLMPE
jgi:transforming growth factor-beta-induced protein